MNLILILLLVLISTIFGAFGGLFFKMGSAFPINLKNKKLMLAVVLSGVSLLFYIYALRFAHLTLVYLTTSVGYLWAIILAKVVLKEEINKFKIAGLSLIVLGIITIHL